MISLEKDVDLNNSVELAQKIRSKVLDLCYQKKTSHIGGAFSVADILAVLYSQIMDVNPQDPAWDGRDRLLYSKGHACTALYAVLEEQGFFTHLMEKFCKDGEYFTSHVNHLVPGIELSTGSLGHALSFGCGLALAAKRKKKSWKTFVIVSDGEMNEGSNWEAILFAPHHKLDNLVLIVDYNKMQSFGSTNEVLNLEPLRQKFEAFNWNVNEIDGHNHDELIGALGRAKTEKQSKPTVVIAHTVKGKGVSFMENRLEWHYKSPNEEQFHQAKKELEKGLGR